MVYISVNWINDFSTAFVLKKLVTVNKLNFIFFGFKETKREISTAGGEVIYLFFQIFFLQTKFRSKTSSVLK